MQQLQRMALSAILAMAITTIGCFEGEDDSGGGVTMSCQDYSLSTECLDYSGSDWTEPAAEFHCQGMTGIIEASNCPTEGRVGRCTTSGDGLDVTHNYYEQPADAEYSCTLAGGLWTVD